MILFYTAITIVVITILGALEQIPPVRKLLDHMVERIRGEMV